MSNHIHTSECGMTLIELLIVLALLAGLATFALTSMDDLSARSRYEVTVERMKRVDVLIRGDGIKPGRFVSDMGRLPTNVCELWESTLSFGAVKYTNKFAGTAITGELHCGWGGPYLVVPGSKFYDGFGDEFVFDDPVSYLATTGLAGHVSWLTSNLSNSYASVTNCSLQVQVYGLRNIPVESEAVWDLVSNANHLPCPGAGGSTNVPYQLYLYQTNVYVCCHTNLDTVPTGSNWWPLTQHTYLSEAEVMLRVPYVGASIQTTHLLRDITTNNPCVFECLTPGVRDVMAYGRSVGAVTNNGWWSGVQSVELKSGMNFLKLYLTEVIPP